MQNPRVADAIRRDEGIPSTALAPPEPDSKRKRYIELIGGRLFTCESKLEVLRLQRAEEHLRAGRIEHYDHNAVRVRLGRGAWYKSDVAIWRAGERMILEEAKGYWREAALVRIKAAAERYPGIRFVALRLANGVWSVEDFSPRYRDPYDLV